MIKVPDWKKCEYVEKYIKESEQKTSINQAWADRGIIRTFTEYLVEIDFTKRYTWMGRPIIQYPTDLMVLQELIWKLEPDLIIETGTAFGGTAVFYASILEAMGKGRVITVDNDLRYHNRRALERHPLSGRITPVTGDSIATTVIDLIGTVIGKNILQTVMVCLDSNHTHSHVMQELALYSCFVSPGSYMIVFDTAIELMMKEKPADRPWGPGDNPYTAVQEFMSRDKRFVVDREIEQRAMITAAPGGWLRRLA
jgi:cephalosporin hydroxylase